MRLWHDLLAPAPRLAGGWHLEPDPPGTARPVAGCRQDRLVAGVDRQQHGAGGLRQGGHRAEPRGPGQAGQQAPRHHRRLGHPAGRVGDAGQPQRHQRDGPSGQQTARGGRQGGPPQAEARRLAGGPGRRLRAAPAGAAGHGDRAGLAGAGYRRGSGLGETRWPVERTLSWVHQNRSRGGPDTGLVKQNNPGGFWIDEAFGSRASRREKSCGRARSHRIDRWKTTWQPRSPG